MAKTGTWDTAAFMEEALKSSSSTRRCKFWNLVVEAGASEAVQVVLVDDRIKATTLHKLLAKKGLKIGLTSVQKHRRYDCQCFSEDST